MAPSSAPANAKRPFMRWHSFGWRRWNGISLGPDSSMGYRLDDPSATLLHNSANDCMFLGVLDLASGEVLLFLADRICDPNNVASPATKNCCGAASFRPRPPVGFRLRSKAV